MKKRLLEIGINVFLALIIVFSFIVVGFINNNIFCLFLAIIFYSFISKSSKIKPTGRLKKWIIVTSMLFAVFEVVGHVTDINMRNYDVSIIGSVFKIKNIISIGGLFTFFYYLLSYIYYYLCHFSFTKKDNYNTKKLFIIFLIVMLIGWSIYFLTHFPGILSSDSFDILGQIKGDRPINNHHPVFYTLYIKLFYEIGVALFHSTEGGVTVFSIAQMITLAAASSYLLVFLYKKKIPILFILLFLMFFTFSPIMGFYSITMWKDVLFGAVFTLFIISIYKLCEDVNRFKVGNCIFFIITSILVNLLRNNAIFIYIVFIPFFIYIFRKKLKEAIIIIISILILFFTIKYSVLNLLNAPEPSSSESIAIPLQQVARIVVKDGNISDDERKLINDLISIDTIKQVYAPEIVDNIKFNPNYHAAIFNDNKGKYLGLWLNLVIKNLDISVDSYLCSTLGYWYPNYYKDAMVTCDTDNDYNYKQKNIIFSLAYRYTQKVASTEISIFSLQYSIALYFYITFIFMGVVIVKKIKNYILCYIPIWGLWLTLMIATPDNGVFRYIFGVVVALPLLISIPYMKDNE